MATFRKVLLFLVFLIVCSLVMMYKRDNPPPWYSWYPFPQSSNSSLLDTPGCTIEDLDPFDATARAHNILDRLPEIQCNESLGLTYVDGEYIRINATVRSRFYDSDGNASRRLDRCEYQAILRSPSSDYHVSYNASIVRFDDGGVRCGENDEFVRVSCFDADSRRIYVNFHALVHRQDQRHREWRSNSTKTNRTSNGTGDAYNVLLLVMDSTSRLNSIRHLVETRRFLLQEIEGIEFVGYNRVAENTYPNMLALLAGLKLEELGGRGFDDVPSFVWKRFKDIGYRTLFGEDGWPFNGMFVIAGHGFVRPPTDYYMRPLMLALYEHSSKIEELCVGAITEYDLILRWMYDFVDISATEPYFAFFELTEFVHDEVNGASRIDRKLVSFFRRLHEAGHLKRTVVWFLADHGFRMGDWASTTMGFIEASLLMNLVVLPPSFIAIYPSMVDLLRINAAERMTTHFDVYETLLHLAELADEANGSSTGRRGVSLFREVISPNRTCKSMQIDEMYCGCGRRTVPTPSSMRVVVVGLVERVVKQMNDVMKVHGGRCAELTLLKESVESEFVVDELTHDRNKPTHYSFKFSTRPGGGQFNAMIHHFHADNTFRILGSVGRSNRYGNQSACIDHFLHRKWCYCV